MQHFFASRTYAAFFLGGNGQAVGIGFDDRTYIIAAVLASYISAYAESPITLREAQVNSRDRNSLERRLQHLESIKAGQKLLLYSCKKWQDAVLQQIHAALLRYTDHLAGEQYLFLNLLGPESSMHLHVVDIAKDGALDYQPNLMRQLEGSPFHWRTR